MYAYLYGTTLCVHVYSTELLECKIYDRMAWECTGTGWGQETAPVCAGCVQKPGCVRDWGQYRNGRDLSRRRPMGVSYGQSIHIQCNGLLPLPFWHGTVFNVIEDQDTIQKAKLNLK